MNDYVEWSYHTKTGVEYGTTCKHDSFRYQYPSMLCADCRQTVSTLPNTMSRFEVPVWLTQAEYDALTAPDPNVMYCIKGVPKWHIRYTRKQWAVSHDNTAAVHTFDTWGEAWAHVTEREQARKRNHEALLKIEATVSTYDDEWGYE